MTEKCHTFDLSTMPAAETDRPTAMPSQSFSHLGGLSGFLIWTSYLGASCWEGAMQRCSAFEYNTKIVHGVDCGAHLGFYFFAAVLAYLVSGHVSATALAFLRAWSGERATKIDSKAGALAQSR